MARASSTALPAALAALCLGTLLTATPVAAAPVVTVLSGLLVVSVPTAASLTTAGSTVSGSLGTSTVVDGRLGATGYDVSVSTTGFDLVGAESATSATHIPASAVAVTNTAVTGGTSSNLNAVALPAAAPIFRLSYPSQVLALNLPSTYTLSLSLTVPAEAGPGRYTGTVTQTVV